jgi:hypothetical protein
VSAELITMTPSFSGESFGANVMEGVLVALAGKGPDDMSEDDYLRLAEEINWRPGVTELAGA